MIVYHGSNTVVQHPDVIHTCRNLDFGKGFYVTTVREQAERWAKRKADFAGGTPVVDCRDGGEQYLQYDVIIGKVANDKVFRVVDMYHQGIWDKDRALKKIRVYPTYDQIAFVTQDAINQLLKFVKSEEMKE